MRPCSVRKGKARVVIANSRDKCEAEYMAGDIGAFTVLTGGLDAIILPAARQPDGPERSGIGPPSA